MSIDVSLSWAVSADGSSLRRRHMVTYTAARPRDPRPKNIQKAIVIGYATVKPLVALNAAYIATCFLCSTVTSPRA